MKSTTKKTFKIRHLELILEGAWLQTNAEKQRGWQSCHDTEPP